MRMCYTIRDKTVDGVIKITARFVVKESILFAVVGIIGVLAVAGWFWIPGFQRSFVADYANAATTSAVTVTASVAQSISCSTNVTTSTFGTLSDASISTSASDASSTMSCGNIAAGCTFYVKDAGGGGNPGLWNSTSSALIESPNGAFSATTTLVAGIEGYGVRATTTGSGGSGASLSIALRYNIGLANGLGSSANAVGGFLITDTTLASTTATTSNREVLVTHKAAISSVTPAGTYNDTITYSCLAN